MSGFWDMLGPGIGTLLLIYTTLERIIPDDLWFAINRFFQNLLNFFNPYIEITFDELSSSSSSCFFERSKAYSAIETYLGTNFSLRAERLKGNIPSGSRSVALSMDDYEEITDVYKGVKVSWMRNKTSPRSNVISFGAHNPDKRSYILSFRAKHKDIVIGSYLSHVLSEGKAIAKRNKRQRLFMNVSSDKQGDWGDEKKLAWRSIAFEHPATFDTLGMDPKKKKDVMDDLVAFTNAKDYYKGIGKPWKRGYLLYGPPGTGKSTMIAAMANFLHYDVYDLELTAVKNNTELRMLMTEISKRSIVVIEDIDCSLGITGRRKNTKNGEKDLKEVIAEKADMEDDDSSSSDDDEDDSKVTLSGLLNSIDGLWSASGGEKIFVFTTNYAEKLDPALIRRGRMDKHIEMSYCCFESFKVLAKNYLKIEYHEKFEKIRCLLEENEMSPADVAENLMPKSAEMSVDECLGNLIAALEKAKLRGQKGEIKNFDVGKRRRRKVLSDLKARMKHVFSRKEFE